MKSFLDNKKGKRLPQILKQFWDLEEEGNYIPRGREEGR